MKNSITILLATYNSSKYLIEQLDSIINQTYTNWKLYIRDDGSTDNTIDIINDYLKLDSRIIFYQDSHKGLGAAMSFMTLLENIDSEFYMFCDHDDYWLPTKIEKSFNLISKEDNSFPIVVHTDLYVVNKELEIMSTSYWKTVGLKPNLICNKELIQVFNCVTGCTMLFNNNAKKCSLPYNSNAPMHDWWIAMQVLLNEGKVLQVEEPLIKYRQHGNNAVGAKKVDILYFIKKIRKIREVIKENHIKIKFLKSINGISLHKYVYYKIYYNILRKL
ncbi:glycosyltransferase family 2 protein [Empedobacter falsenii]